MNPLETPGMPESAGDVVESGEPLPAGSDDSRSADGGPAEAASGDVLGYATDGSGWQPPLPKFVLREEVDRPRGPLRHERSLPLPLRVKRGAFQEDRLVAETAGEALEIPWEQVRLVAVGVIREFRETETQAYQIEKWASTASRMVRGGMDRSRVVSKHETHLMDLYVQGLHEPLRFDSAVVDYRSFLDRALYVSFQNFFRLVHGLSTRATAARFTPGTVFFLSWDRDRMPVFSAIHEFELDATTRLKDLERQAAWADLDLSRTRWAEEWTED